MPGRRCTPWPGSKIAKMSSVRPTNSECRRTRCTDEAQTPNVTDVFVGRPVRPRSRQSAATGR
eukprot:5324218-Heterocapsa_arctica.AAC.1